MNEWSLLHAIHIHVKVDGFSAISLIVAARSNGPQFDIVGGKAARNCF